MPILGKTAQLEKATIALDVIGRVWVGEQKTNNSAGQTLNDKFRVECNDRTREVFKQHYGSDRPDCLNIFLPFPTVDPCYETWMEAYTAQGFQHRCNGERIVQKMCKVPYKGLKGEQRYSWERKDVDEPCLKGDDPECAACGKGSGRFFFYVRELYTAGMGATKAWMMSVSGVHNLTGLHNQLRALQKQYGCLDASPVPSPWTFGFIPYTLTRVEKPIMRPNQEKGTVNGKTVYNQTGTRSKGSYWGLSIAEDPAWLATLQKFMAFQEVQRLGGSAEAIALIGGDIPLLQGYQETSMWGRTSRDILQATNPRQIAAAIDVVRDEVMQGNLPPQSLAQAEQMAGLTKPKEAIALPKPAIFVTPAVNEEVALLKKFQEALELADSVEKVNKIEVWIHADKQWAIAANIDSIDHILSESIKGRMKAIAQTTKPRKANTKPPGLDDETPAIDTEIVNDDGFPELPLEA